MKKTRLALMGSASNWFLELEQTCEIVSKAAKVDKEAFVTSSLCGGFRAPEKWLPEVD
jgi:hypothetical protein